MTSRRQFLQGLLAGLALTAVNPLELLAQPSLTGQPVLVAVHLTGGNDALNTLVPHRNRVYRKARPNLALSSKNLLDTDRGLALHSSLSHLHQQYHNGNVLLLPGIGRDDHDRSHFRSSDIWHGAGKPGSDGWMAGLARRLQTTPISLGDSVSRAVACPGHPPIGLIGDGQPQFPRGSSLEKTWFNMYRNWEPTHRAANRLKRSAGVLEELTTKLEGKMATAKIKHNFAGDKFGKRFALAYRLIASGFPASVLHISAGSFDTHSNQLGGHADQLAQFDRASWTFLENMKTLGRPATLMVYSEFGRRVAENFSGGTDHGAGGLAWLVGAGVRGGIEGSYQLDDLRDGDLPTKINYRNLYIRAVSSSFGDKHSRELFQLS